MTHLLIWLIFSPILLASLIHFIKKYLADIGFLIFLAFSIFNCWASFKLFQNYFFSEVIVYKVGNWSFQKGIILVADKLSLPFLVMIHVLFLFSLLFSKGYVKRDHATFFSLFYLLQAGLSGMVLTGDLFNLYVFLEIVSIVSYALVAYDKTDEGVEAGFKYLLVGSVASLIIIWGIGIIYATTNSLNLALIATYFKNVSPLLRGVVSIFFLVGFGIKFALFPLHPWLADAHASAPSPVSAILSGVVVKVQIYGLLRIFTIIYSIDYLKGLNLNSIIIALGIGNILIGHLMALKQKNLKRMLAYSSIAHLGYIIIGLISATEGGVIGSFYHMINHGVLKAGLFFFAGTLIYHLNIKDIKDLKGLFWRNPLLGIFFSIFASGMVGIPPLNGFFSKWLIIMGIFKGGYSILAAVITLGSFISLIYYLRVFILMLNPSDDKEKFKVDLFFLVPVGSMVVLSFVLVIFGNEIYSGLEEILHILKDNGAYIEAVFHS